MNGPAVKTRPPATPDIQPAAKRGLYARIILGLSAIGPGLILIAYEIGPGSVTTMAMAGAQYGMSLLWALLLSGIFTYILMVAFGRLTLVTGQTALMNFKTRIPKIGKFVAIYIMVTLIFGEMLSLIAVMGIAAEMIQEGIRLASADRTLMIQTGWIILALTAVILFILWHGKYKLLEKILSVLVLVMLVCFVGVLFVVSPSYSAILSGVIPGIPDTPGAARLVAAMAGTTSSAALFVVRSTVIAEKGWTIDDLETEKRDALFSTIVIVFLSAVIMAVGAGTLYVMGQSMTSTLEMIGLFEPIGGDLAAFLIIIGVTGAALSTIFPLVMIAPWLVADYMGWSRDLRAPVYRLLMAGALVFGFGTVFLDQPPPVLMVAAMALQAVILPAVAIPAFYLMNKREIVGEKRLPSRGWNAGMIAVIIFALVTTWFAITGLSTA